MSIYAVSRFSKNFSIVGMDVVDSWWLCGRRSNFL